MKVISRDALSTYVKRVHLIKITFSIVFIISYTLTKSFQNDNDPKNTIYLFPFRDNGKISEIFLDA